MIPVLVFWLLFVIFIDAFAAQVARRVRLILAAPNTFNVDRIAVRAGRWLGDVLFQRRTILERPIPGVAHALVFWGFIAFAGYTTVEFLKGLGIVDLTATSWFHKYRMALTPFAAAVLAGILVLLVRRAFHRPVALGSHVSAESIVIRLFIAMLMITYLPTFLPGETRLAGHLNWWLHVLGLLALMGARRVAET